GTAITAQASWPVQPNDWLEIGTGSRASVYKIMTVASPNVSSLTIYPADPSDPNYSKLIFPTTTLYTNDWRIVRAPRVRAGEPPLQLPPDTAIDVYPNSAGGGFTSALPTSNAASSTDIVFSPFGGVIANGVSGNDIRLW